MQYTSLEDIKKAIGFTMGGKLVLNGFNKKTANYISDACLHSGILYIRRLRWIRIDNSIEHIYLIPDFVLPYFKFPINDYEYFIKNESRDNYLYGVEDPQCVVDSDMEIERDLVRLNRKINEQQVLGSVNSRYTSLSGSTTIPIGYLTVECTKFAALWTIIKAGTYILENSGIYSSGMRNKYKHSSLCFINHFAGIPCRRKKVAR